MKSEMKEHLFAQLATDLKEVARTYGSSQQLREHIVLTLINYIDHPTKPCQNKEQN